MRKRYQVMAEFAIGFPLLLFLFFGVMQIIFIYIDTVVVQYAAYQAARAYVSSSDLDVNKTSSYDPLVDEVKGPVTDKDRAHLAVALICTPMTFGGKPETYAPLPDWFSIGEGQNIYWPGWSSSTRSNLGHIEDSWHTTNVRVIDDWQPSNPDARKVEVEVDHDLLMIFPLAGFMVTAADNLFGSDYDAINAKLEPTYQKTYGNRHYHRVTVKCVMSLNPFASSQYEN